MSTSTEDVQIEDLDPSELGTKDHWESAYIREISNFTSNPNDEGIIWFDECGAETRILRYLSQLPVKPSSILDVGTGNGHLLFEILDDEDLNDEDQEGGEIQGPLIGIDYSPASITLCQTIAETRDPEKKIQFFQADVIKDNLIDAPWVPREAGGFDCVLDKGTFDAISLSEETLEDGRRVVEAYPKNVAAVVKKGGWLIVTSCNWTEEELRKRMEAGCAELRFFGRVAYPSITFGGVKGSTICTVAWQRV
ncbi:S-adenosyl-L-methionine-dependent methyltransferase [Pyronema omphalodes]|nr:S-adenosyl-L-methionine-dependent methyltransferase [Pyronema omphalodes]